MAETHQVEDKRVLLPTHVLPTHYHVHLTPDVEGLTFVGEGSIQMDVKRTVDKNTITLHAVELVLDKSKIKLTRFEADGATVSSEATTDTFVANEEEETVTFEFNGAPFKVGEKLALSLAWSGRVNAACAGVYQSDCIVNGITKYAALTASELPLQVPHMPCTAIRFFGFALTASKPLLTSYLCTASAFPSCFNPFLLL